MVALGFLKNSAHVPMSSISNFDEKLINKPSHSGPQSSCGHSWKDKDQNNIL